MASRAISPRAPGTTPQSVQTPPSFLDAVRHCFGKLIIDWAADCNNVVGNEGVWFGQDQSQNFVVTDANGKDKVKNNDPGSLILPWGDLYAGCRKDQTKLRLIEEWSWLNPPFSSSKQFIIKCAEEVANEVDILCLVQTATASEYWKRYVLNDPFCKVVFLTGRIPFVGYGNSANIDTSLLIWSNTWFSMAKFWLWDWRTESAEPEPIGWKF